ncbi:MAG: polysaccharide deacetylase family protein [Deltaproteobacteria bacterium]|nr:polysaccharide deacetylase family protein [Deltaproteobacteria bacterium]
MARERLLCVSVDLDGPGCYHEIHGLPAPGESLADRHYTRGLARFLSLFDELGVKATLFAVGRDLERSRCASILADACTRGHEAANHTMTHPYAFSRLGPDAVRDEIRSAAERIREAGGQGPRGFRAPGYHINDGIVSVLEELGYAYDASLLPSPAYYLAKVGVMTWMRATGRKSLSVAGHPGMTLSPGRPYRMGRSYWREGNGLPELPCSVLPVVRVPFIGTTLSLAGRSRSVMMARIAARGRWVGLEFHAIDLMDDRGDGLDVLSGYQPDVRVAVDEKTATFRAVLRVLLDAGFASVTHASALERLF